MWKFTNWFPCSLFVKKKFQSCKSMSMAVRRKKSLIARMNICIMDDFLQNKRCNHIFNCIFSIQRNVLLKKNQYSTLFSNTCHEQKSWAQTANWISSCLQSHCLDCRRVIANARRIPRWFMFFCILIINGFITALTIRCWTALWEGDSRFGYTPQNYMLLYCRADNDK